VRILAVADAEERALGEHFDASRWRGVDLIVSCGDLEPEYLDYLVSRLNVPCYYVRGNHDAIYAERPPGGCESLHGRVVTHRGLRFAGIEGSLWYGGKGVEYGERALAWRSRLLDLRARITGGVDVIVTHSPPLLDGEAEATDKVHRGVAAYTELLKRQKPLLFLHGHTHLGYGRGQRERRVGVTRVIDCYGHALIEVEPRRSPRV
jgi:Icc-related predicted phosphoesterase